MSQVQVEQKNYQMPPQDGFTIAHFLTVSDIDIYPRPISSSTTSAQISRTAWFGPP